MEAQIKLGRIFGIVIGLHYSWLIIAVLISLSLAAYFSGQHPDWPSATVWVMSIATSVLFFSAILVHELSHAAVAIRNGMPVRSITLFALGGVANIEKEAPSAKIEFWMAIVGPITSAVIGGIFLLAAYLLGWSPMTEPDTPLMTMAVWLGYINIALAVFNMIPGFPMDGGRVLRAVIWWITKNASKATRIASLTGQVFAFIFILIGIVRFFGGAGIGGLWMAFIGWFLLNAAKATYLQDELNEGLKGLKVGDLMTEDCTIVNSTENLHSIVHEHMLRSGQRCFIVSDNGSPAGMITPHEVKAVEERKWPFTVAADAMKPIEDLFVVGPEMPVTEALEIIGRNNVNQLPVIENGRLAGIISRDAILNYIVTKRELGS